MYQDNTTEKGPVVVTMNKKSKDGEEPHQRCRGLENLKQNKTKSPPTDGQPSHQLTVASLMCSFDNWVDFLQIVEHL